MYIILALADEDCSLIRGGGGSPTCVHSRIWNQHGACCSGLTVHTSPAAQMPSTEASMSLASPTHASITRVAKKSVAHHSHDKMIARIRDGST
jgi:hypothetical protein